LADGTGRVARALLASIGRSSIEAEILSVESVPVDNGPGVVLALGVLHGQAMDWAVQKAVELGVRTLVPTITARVQISGRAAVGRLRHWRSISRQALKQCRRPWEMEVGEPTALADLVAARGSSGGVLADPGGAGLDSIPSSTPCWLLVGPEGGLTSAERASLPAETWPRLCLGPHVLRADTAAVVGAALLISRQRGSRNPASEIPDRTC